MVLAMHTETARRAPNRIRELRETNELERYDLAARIRVDQATIGRWETGATIPDNRKRQLAELFGVSRAHLMGWDEEDPTP